MSALPNPLLHPQRKPAGKASKPAKLNKYRRDPGSPSERVRVSDWEHQDFAPFAPFPMSFLADLPRLMAGKADTWLVLAIWAKSAGRGVAPKQRDPKVKDFWQGAAPGRRPEWSLALDVSEWANLARCSERQVERELDNLKKRGVIDFEKTGLGKYRARLLFRDWEALPDYKSDVIEMPTSDSTTSELTEEQEAKPGNQRVTGKSPVRVPAGGATKAYPVTEGVKEFQAIVKGPVDCDISAVVKAGRCVTVIQFPDDWREKLLESLKVSNETNELHGTFRHGRRKTEEPPGENPGRKTPAVDHPRAAELVNLFDPFLSKQAVGLLVMDSASLRKSCEAIADIDHDYLVKFVVQRAATPIKSSKFVPAICEDALRAWKTSKVLVAAGAPKYSRADIDRMIAEERAAKAKVRK